MDWTTSQSNHFNVQMPCDSTSLNSISVIAITVGLAILRISPEHYTTAKSSNVFRSFLHISHFRGTSNMIKCTLLTWNDTKHTVTLPPMIGAGIWLISLRFERHLWLAFSHPMWLTWPNIWAISTPCHCISRLLILKKITNAHLSSMPGFLLGWFHDPRILP